MNYLLVDGNNLVYRAHYAHRDLTTRKNEPTGVLYGALAMLQTAIRVSSTREVCIFFDDDPENYQRTPTFRSRIFTQYKAHRVKDATAVQQIWAQTKILAPIFRLLKYQVHFVSGIEADDLIGVTARHLREEEAGRIVLYSGDTDYYQLVRGGVKLLKPHKELGGVLHTRKTLATVVGYDPVKAAHYKAIAGDTADNFKGVPGLGTVAAVHLLANGFDSATPYEELPLAIRKKARNSRNWSEGTACYNLARIRTKVDCSAFSDSEKKQLRNMLASIRGYQRDISAEDRKQWVRFERFCKRWELVSFMMQRAEFFS